MPTVKPRIQVTETPELAQALAIAEELWPGESKSTQVCRLAELGSQSAVEARTRRLLLVQEIQKYVRTHLGGVYEGATIAEMRDMWERDAS